MRITLLMVFLFAAPGAIAQPVLETHYLDRYAHPQESLVSLQMKVGLVSLQMKVGLTGLLTTDCSLMEPVNQNLFLKPNLSLGIGCQFLKLK